MKKLLCLFMFLFLLISMPVTKVTANSGPPIVGITIMPDVCDIDYDTEEIMFPGNIDILVRLEDFADEDFGPMTSKFKEFYPFYEDIDYLDSIPTGWTSFSAFYTREHKWDESIYWCGMEFADYRMVPDMEYIRVVYFDDEGNTLLLSDEIEIPNVYFYQDMDSIIYLNTTDNTIEVDMNPVTDGYFFLAVFAVLALILYSVFIEVITALVLKLRTKKALLNILLINFVTQALMYLYFFVIFDGYTDQYYLHLFIYEILVLIVEFLYLNWRLKSQFTWKRLALYVLISNIISYLLGIIRYF